MSPLLEGIKWGLLLTILVGPIFFALLQAGIEYGIRAGFFVGLGIWLSDFLFISSVYLGMSYIKEVTAFPGFEFWMGMVGGIILVSFGLGSIFSKPPDFEESPKLKAKTLGGFFLKGFLINTINPFTILFWTGIMTTVVIGEAYTDDQAKWFFIGILGTISLTDFLKILFAKYIRNRLKPSWFLWLRRISGAALFLFGIILFIRVIYRAFW